MFKLIVKKESGRVAYESIDALDTDAARKTATERAKSAGVESVELVYTVLELAAARDVKTAADNTGTFKVATPRTSNDAPTRK